MSRVIFLEGQPYMPGTETYPGTYSPDRPAFCYEEEPGVWVIRYAGEKGTTICEYGTEATEEKARQWVDVLNGHGRPQQIRNAIKAADKLARERERLAQGRLL